MSKSLNSLHINFLFIVCLVLLTSCSYEDTTIKLGSGFDSTWTFSNSTEYEFDENLVEVVNGKAQLKVLDLEHSGDDFNSGNHVGTYFSSLDQNKSLIYAPNDTETHLNTILPSKASNLVGYWRFDDGFEDGSLHSNDGSSSGGALLNTDSKVGDNSLLLDGDDDYISIAHSSSLDINNAIAISLWFKSSSLVGNDGGLVSKSLDSVNKYFGNSFQKVYELGVLDNVLYFQIGDGTNRDSVSVDVSSYINGNWNHIVATWEGVPGLNNLLIFINGVMVAQANSTINAIQSTQNVLDIGGQSTIYNFSGNIDEVGLWNSNLSSAEVRYLYEVQNLNYTELSPSWTPKYDNIVGYWKMDGNWQDSSGKGNHGSRLGTGDSSIEFTSSFKKVGVSAGSFDGVDDIVEIADSTSFNSITTEVSVSGWAHLTADINITAGNDYRFILSKGAFAGSSFYLILEEMGNGYNFNITVGGDRQICGFPIAYIDVQDRWVHLAATFNTTEGTCSIYMNGVLKTSKNDIKVGSIDSSVSALKFGALDGTFNRIYPGYLDDFSIWSKELTMSDVQLIYNRQKQKYAGHYDSQVIDLGNTNSTWPDLSWSTSLPFGKELVGDFDNDGSPDSESSSNYSILGGNLSDQIVGYWSFNETILNGYGIADFFDSSGQLRHATESNSVSISERSNLKYAIEFIEGSNHYIELGDFEVGNDFSFSAWINPKEFRKNFGQAILAKHDSLGGNLLVVGCYYDKYHVNIRGQTYEAGDCIESGWHHVAFTISSIDGISSSVNFFVNGVLVWARTLNAVLGTLTPGRDWSIGQDWDVGVNSDFFFGQLDEVAIWSRAMTPAEVQQLYRRGANRIKLQVKSCVDSSCNCKSYGIGGTETDCDGDGTLNTADTDDTHKSEFIGPGGDGTTYYSELFNRTNTDVTFNCVLNTTDSNAGVCVEDEITLTAGPKPTGPEFLNIDYTQFIKPPANRYAQYRVYMEADDNTACGGEPCLPELTSVSLNPVGSPRYSSEYIKVKPKSPITFTKLLSAQIDAEPCATFRLSRSNTEYYYDGASWVLATADAHRNLASVVESNITKFASDHGVGKLEVNAYLRSDTSQSTQCSVNSVDIKYE